ncbi:S1C family serine protease [Leptospira idonii]|uniref:Serine protease n=1 Tax=Leptospira idonii TaxID=1193500 RepID=A0A4R9M651_9LEPT|nr:S1C family serine protease [Leptospira idonii]TGN21147.1 serine protease [Leptospira idonii]
MKILPSLLLGIVLLLSCQKEKNSKEIFRSYVGASFSISLDSGSLEEPKVWTGSGFVFDRQGLGLTCSHVVPDDKIFTIRMGGIGQKFFAKVIKRDVQNDLALVQWEASESQNAFNLENSVSPETGSVYYMISTPMGMEESFDSGWIANRSRTGADIFLPNHSFIQLNRMVLSGSSGAPVFDEDGNIFGMARFQISGDGSKRDGIGFAIPSHVIREFAKSIPVGGRTKEEIQRGIVEIPVLTAHLVSKLSLGENRGVLVSYVESGSSSETAGVKRYDLILEVNGHSILTAEDLYKQMSQSPSDKNVELKIFRQDRNLKLNIAPFSRKER